MAAYNDKESVVPTHLNVVPLPNGLSVVNKQTGQTSNNSSASFQNGLTESERLQTSLQTSIEPHSSARIGILDLADELLLDIFDHGTDSADIRNIRLTCGRFCSTSSHLLLDCLDVRLTAASLARAKEISCHPTVARGIRILHISLQSITHLPSAAEFRLSVIDYIQKNFSLVMDKGRHALQNGDFTSFAESRSVLRERKHLLNSWYQYQAEQSHSTYQQGLDVEALRRGYEKYRTTYEWQIRATEDGTFAQAIAAAAGRMPRATKLLFTDRSRYRERSPDMYGDLFKHNTRAFDVFDDKMMLSIGATELAPKVMPIELEVQVPLAIHAAGFPAVEVGVRWDIPVGISPDSKWIRDQAQLLSLKAAAESLKIFTFQTCLWSFSSAKDISSVSTYLRVVLEASNLQVLTLSLTSYHALERRPGSMLASRCWPQLREINVTYISFHINELKRFVEGVRPGILFNFKPVRLHNGTWAEGLDVLRSKASSESQIGTLAGAECMFISQDQLRQIFGGGKASWASQYVQGFSIRNPFLVTKDETGDEETNATTT